MHGELTRLGYQVSQATVRRILHARGFRPAPCGLDTSWRTFLRTQVEGLLACDFLTAEQAARQPDDESEVPAGHTEHASRYPVQVRSITRHLLADGYAVTWAPAPAGCSLTPGRRGPRGEHDAYRGTGPTMQRAWDQVRAQLGHGQPQPAAGTREAPGPARGSDRLYRVVQYYDSWPFHHDSRIPHGSKSRRRTDTFRTLGPVRDRLARANGYARYQRRNGGDWAAFVAIAEQLTDDGWQPIDVDLR